MANCKEFYFPSADGKTQIHVCEWSDVKNPVGVVQIAHGVAEYAARYEPFAEFLNAHGMIVTANDHIGHGASVAEGAPRLCFGKKNGWQNVTQDLYTLRDLTGRKYPDLPYFLMGHSMGSFLARTYLIRYPGTVYGAIIMGTAQQPSALLAAGRAFAAFEKRRIGCGSYSPAISNLAFGMYNMKFSPNRTAYDWLSVNEENVDRYLADPLCGGKISVGLLCDMFGGIAFICDQKNAERMNPNTPVLFISGGQDPVGDMGDGVRKAYRSFQKAGIKDVELKLYEGLRHEILNEDCREAVCNDLWSWIEKH